MRSCPNLLVGVLFLSACVLGNCSGLTKVCKSHSLGGSHISSDGIITVSWECLSSDRLRFDVIGKRSGWVGIGFSDNPSMANTDFVIGFVNDTGYFDLQDRYSDLASSFGQTFPRDVDLGGTNDLEEASGKLENGIVTFSFVRKLNTGDQFDKIIGQADVYLLSACGDVLHGVPQDHGSNKSPVKLSFYPSFEYTSFDGVWKATWKYDPTFEYITFQLTSTFDGWIGLGISETGTMLSTDFVISWVDATTGVLSISDRFSDPSSGSGHSEPIRDVDIGGSDDLVNATGSREEVGGVMTTTVSFTRKCDTGDQYDAVISNREIYLLWAYGTLSSSGAMNRHTSRDSIPINFQEGRPEDPASRGVSAIKAHASLMMLSWSVLVVPFTILARYFKKSVKTWFSYHRIINTLAILAIFVAFVVILIDNAHFHPSAHAIIGTTLVGLAIIQGIIGQISNLQWFEGKTPSFWPDKIHWYVGRLVILLALVNTFLGLDLFGAETAAFILYSASVGISLVYIIYLETKVGQTIEQPEYEGINVSDNVNEKDQRPSFGLFLVYWLAVAGLVIVTLALILA